MRNKKHLNIASQEIKKWNSGNFNECNSVQMRFFQKNCLLNVNFSAAILEHSLDQIEAHPDMRIEDVKDGVGPVPLGLLQLPPDLLPPGGGEDRDLLPGHGLTALLHSHRGQGCHVRQRLLPLDGGVTQHLVRAELSILNMILIRGVILRLSRLSD